MPATTGAEIAARTGRWPLNSVPYSQVSTASPTGHRCDCSGYASMALGLPTPGESTVTLVTEGHARRIGWAELAPGDLVMLGGPNTGGNDGHVAVVTEVDPTRAQYRCCEQSGGWGPDANTYRIGQAARPGMVPYRSTYLTTPPPQEEAMSVKLIAPDAGYGKGSVYKVYPTPLGLALEKLEAELGAAVALWGQEVHVQDARKFGTPIEELRAEWERLARLGAGPTTVTLTPGPMRLTGDITPATEER